MPGILDDLTVLHSMGALNTHPFLQINPLANVPGISSMMGGGRMPPAANRNTAPQSAPGNVMNMTSFLNGQIRSRNLKNFGDSGGYITDTLPNGWMLGRNNTTAGLLGETHILLDPQGSPALAGWSQRGLIHEGFDPDERGPLLDYLNAR